MGEEWLTFEDQHLLWALLFAHMSSSLSNLCGTDLRRENSNAEKEEWRTVRLRQGLRGVKVSNLERDGRIQCWCPATGLDC
jgi:hypothetical protein